MSRHVRAAAYLFAMLLMVIAGCKKTAESESARWKTNSATVDKLQAQYPGFKPALEGRLKVARADYEAASSLSGEAQVEKMASANRTLMAGYVSDLGKLETSIKELRDKRVEAAAKAGDESSRLAAKLAAEDAGKTLDRIEAILAKGASDDASANAIVDKVEADLKAATSAVDKVLSVDKDKKDEKAADKKAEADKAEADKAEAEAKVADWKCEYCATPNKHDHTKCESCGAPRGGKAAPPAGEKPAGK